MWIIGRVDWRALFESIQYKIGEVNDFRTTLKKKCHEFLSENAMNSSMYT
jgi:hypothetical protein